MRGTRTVTVFLTGDLHGATDIAKFSKRNWPLGATLGRDDYVIVLGDFGLVWSQPPSADETHWLDWLENRPWTTLFIDGNHENFDVLETLPVSTWAGGSVQYVRPHVLHLMRGQVFTIEGMRFLAMGGAYSTDKRYRTPHLSWWPQEVPNEQERAHVLAAAQDAAHVDFVLTHAPSERGAQALAEEFELGQSGPIGDEYMAWLDELGAACTWRRWYFGHMHVDAPWMSTYTPLYRHIVELPAGKDVTRRANEASGVRAQRKAVAAWRVRLDGVLRDDVPEPHPMLGRYGRLVEQADGRVPSPHWRGWTFDMQERLDAATGNLEAADGELALRFDIAHSEIDHSRGGERDSCLILEGAHATYQFRVLSEAESAVLDAAWERQGRHPLQEPGDAPDELAFAHPEDARTFTAARTLPSLQTEYLVAPAPEDGEIRYRNGDVVTFEEGGSVLRGIVATADHRPKRERSYFKDCAYTYDVFAREPSRMMWKDVPAVDLSHASAFAARDYPTWIEWLEPERMFAATVTGWPSVKAMGRTIDQAEAAAYRDVQDEIDRLYARGETPPSPLLRTSDDRPPTKGEIEGMCTQSPFTLRYRSICKGFRCSSLPMLIDEPERYRDARGTLLLHTTERERYVGYFAPEDEKLPKAYFCEPLELQSENGMIVVRAKQWRATFALE